MLCETSVRTRTELQTNAAKDLPSSNSVNLVCRNEVELFYESDHRNTSDYTGQHKYSRTSNNGHCRGIQILSVIGGVR
jgi:hypothetical protein